MSTISGKAGLQWQARQQRMRLILGAGDDLVTELTEQQTKRSKRGATGTFPGQSQRNR